ncbi:MAG: hypothetical protein D6741_15090 [Planctomycetota bacterium]|nr:MAG: hypothetical protein D6741_15090 [Planctomycetota bacterium]
MFPSAAWECSSVLSISFFAIDFRPERPRVGKSRATIGQRVEARSTPRDRRCVFLCADAVVPEVSGGRLKAECLSIVPETWYPSRVCRLKETVDTKTTID